MECTCTPCPECKGTGTVWISFSKEYMGSNRCDDLDEMDVCDVCGGDGVQSYCQGCLDAEEERQEREWEEERLHNERQDHRQ